jgi:hypothetical protein
MRYALVQIGVLTGIIGLLVVLGRGIADGYWGTSGSEALMAAGVICWIAAVLAALPIGWTATHHPEHTAPVALAGTGIRLLGTAAIGLGYQFVAQPNRTAFMACILVVYMAALLAETIMIVYIVQRVPASTASKTE